MALLRCRCPHCGARALWWPAALGASPARPARCRECGGLSCATLWSQLVLGYGALVFTLAGLILPFVMASAWALAVAPLGWVGLALAGRHWPLQKTTVEAAIQAQGRAGRYYVFIAGGLLAWMLLAWLG